ncbi:hypothetical protein [Paremcibacter congregatus]|uniref:hypothetical protein n=1 Tax=Paremcibacter congregatus TaxID=2043170 RepID=UPI0030ECF33F|tara:strand:+ start:6218 stop:6550 length:333 start_codon:yes stop_codon:yes gene_type:complete
MIHTATTCKIITAALVTGFTLTASTKAIAHDPVICNDAVPSYTTERMVSKQNARKLVKELLRREYNGENLQARGIHKDGDVWKVKIWRHIRKVATAKVDTKTGNIHIETN